MHPRPTFAATLAKVSVVSLLVTSGCTSLDDAAKDKFSSSYSCPPARIEIRKRPDVKPSALLGTGSVPPRDVAADPARLAIWQKEQQKIADTWNSTETVFELRGCDHEVLYMCSQAAHHTSTSTGIICGEHKYPAGAAKW